MLAGNPNRRPHGALASKSFAMFIAAQFVSELGGAAFRVGLIVYAIDQFGEGSVGLLLAALSFPQILALLAGGVIADRFGRKRVAICSDVLSGLLFLLLWVGSNGSPSLLAVVVLTGAAGAAIAIFSPAAASLVPMLVDGDEEELLSANAFRVSSGQLAAVAGPAVAGLLLAVVDVRWLFLLNAASFLAAAAIFAPAIVPALHRPVRSERTSVREDISDGLRLLASSAWLVRGVALGASANLVLLPLLMVGIPLKLVNASPDGTLGLYFAAIAVGSTLGAALIAPRAPAGLRTDAPHISIALAGLSTVLALSSSQPALIALLGGTAGLGLGVYEVTWSSRVQAGVPSTSLGRIFSVDAWMSFVGRTTGLLLIGWLADQYGVGTGLLALAGAVVLYVAASYGFERLDEDVPNPNDAPTSGADATLDQPHKMRKPTTTRGRWSLVSLAGFAVFLVTFGLMVATGQRGGDEFFDNLWLAVPGLGAYFAAVAAFLLGALAIATSGERSVSVIGATSLGFLVTAFGVVEVVFTH